MIVRLQCTLCNSSAKAEVDTSKIPAWLDPRALAIRIAVKQLAWCYRGGRISKSVVDMVCFKHRKPMYLDGDIAPADAIPGTYEDDCAIAVDTATDDAHV